MPVERDLLAIISEIYEAALRPDHWAVALERISISVHPEGRGSLQLFDSSLAHGAILAATGYEEPFVRSYLSHFDRLNPWLRHADTLPLGTPLVSEQVFRRDALLKSEFYADWLRPQGLMRCHGILVARDATRNMVVSVMHPDDDGSRDPGRHAVLGQLVPHLLRAAQIHRQVSAATSRAGTMQSALDALSVAAMIVDGTGRLQHANNAAELLLRRREGLSVVDGRLTATTTDSANQLLALIKAVTAAVLGSGGAGDAVRIPRADKPPLTVLVAPAPTPSSGRGLMGVRNAVIFVSLPEDRSLPRLSVLARTYGLTGAEARLLGELLEGSRLEEVAERFSVSINTVRTQLRALLNKTGCSRQAELVREVLLSFPQVRLNGHSPLP